MRRRVCVSHIAVLCVALLTNVCGATDPATMTQRFIDGHVQTLSTKGHPNAKGVHFTIDCPEDWVAKGSGGSRHVVEQFVARDQDHFNVVTIGVVDLSSSWQVLSAQEKADRLADVRRRIPSSWEVISAETTRVQGEPAAIIEHRSFWGDPDFTVATQTWLLRFISSNQLVEISFVFGGVNLSNDRLAQLAADYRPLYVLMANSIVFPGKQTSSESDFGAVATMPANSSLTSSDASRISMATYIRGCLIAIGLGVIGPVLLRFAFMRRPVSGTLSLCLALGVCALAWILLFRLNQTTTWMRIWGLVVLVMFFVAWGIMISGHSRSHASRRPGLAERVLCRIAIRSRALRWSIVVITASICATIVNLFLFSSFWIGILVQYVMPLEERLMQVHGWNEYAVMMIDSVLLTSLPPLLIACLVALILNSLLSHLPVSSRLFCGQCGGSYEELLGPACPECGERSQLDELQTAVDSERRSRLWRSWLLPLCAGLVVGMMYIYALPFNDWIYQWIYGPHEASSDWPLLADFWFCAAIIVTTPVCASLSVLAVLCTHVLLARPPRQRGFYCRHCKYSLQGLPLPPCPSCGHEGTVMPLRSSS